MVMDDGDNAAVSAAAAGDPNTTFSAGDWADLGKLVLRRAANAAAVHRGMLARSQGGDGGGEGERPAPTPAAERTSLDRVPSYSGHLGGGQAMSYGLFLSAAGMQANEYRMNVTANNLANAETVGFKHDLAVLAQRPIERAIQSGGPRAAHPVFDGMSGGTSVRPTYHSFSQGSLDRTGRALDVAVEGEGFFAVRDGDEVRYTRDGRLTFNDAGELVLASGGGRMRVLSDAGLPIQRLEEGGLDVRISDGGIVRQGGEILGRIGLTAFDDQTKVRKVGHNLFDAGDAQTRAAEGRVIPGTVEHSTVEPISALTSMIEVQRAYEMNGRALTAHDRVTGEAVNTVGRI